MSNVFTVEDTVINPQTWPSELLTGPLDFYNQ